MAVNANRPERWKADIVQSVDFYNDWFLRFAPQTYRDNRAQSTVAVEEAFALTANLANIGADVLRLHPSLLPILRMATAPPLARDRLIGLAGVSASLVRSLEIEKRIPPRMTGERVNDELGQIVRILARLLDIDIFPWLKTETDPSTDERYRAATVVADRLCGAISDPIIRNAQEQRQLAALQQWLENRGYCRHSGGISGLTELQPGTFAFRLNVPVRQSGREQTVNLPIDAVVQPKDAGVGQMPLLIEAKSAGDFTNTNKRRKEEATKIAQLRHTYGQETRFVLFLCGYFDSGYLGYEAAEGIDWVWEHRIDDLAAFGV
ncbi:MAG: XamI family restriction endonuclease [Caldilineaceae bacterium]|nr:XamI family restriction endonuclease [Caldilineaceae bacterium]HRJ40472.1 XamI family restriction endonuclease [Caldilineaceae bacterium]